MFPADNVPVVERLFAPKVNPPEDETIEPVVKVKFPRTDPLAAATVPVVERFEAPKEITPPVSKILPEEIVIVPVFKLVDA